MSEDRKRRKKIIVDILGGKEYKPVKIKGLKKFFHLNEEETLEMLDILDELIREGKVIKTAKNKYMINENESQLVGTFISHSKGFGFVEIEEEEEDIFIPIDSVNGAFHGDRVMVQITKEKDKDKRQEGKIISIIERGITTVVGTFEKSQSFGFVVPDNRKFTRDIFIPYKGTMGAMSGHKVEVKLTYYGNAEKKPEGEVIDIIGHVNDPDTELKSIIRVFDLPVEFPEKVMEEIETIPSEIDAEKVLKETNRVDYRDVFTITIDGEDAKDLDDAITIKRVGELYELGVHIADVSQYVTENSALDKEAILRGTSVYLIDKVIPMLPHKLSNGICSLNANEDRLALSCIMQIDKNGNVVSHRIEETVLNVNERMTYLDVKKMLVDKDEEVLARYEYCLDTFKELESLASILRERRRVRGAIDFDFPEAKFILDDTGKIKEIKPYDRNVATKMIEEFMLLANETIAEDFHWQEIPFLYRTHEEPDPEKIKSLREFIYNYGYHMKGKEKARPKEIQKLLAEVEGTDQEIIISRLALRSMKQAKYTTTNDGHFGLATEYYTHFTSPIRRYPDLQIHRIIKDMINGRLTDERYEHYERILDQVAIKTSKLERRAEETEREVHKYRKCEFMEDKVGQMFDGVISGITNWGIYVELENTIEGLIPMNRLIDDYYIYDEKNMCLYGERTSRVFRLGDKLKIGVISVDKRMRTIDFELIYEDIKEEMYV